MYDCKNKPKVELCRFVLTLGLLLFLISRIDVVSATPDQLGETLLRDNYSVVTNNYMLPGHAGIDYRANVNTPVYSPVSGVVSASSSSNGHLAIKINGTDIHFIFLHLNQVDFDLGDPVNTKDQVGLSGSTLYNGFPITGPHLHVEARKGRSNPADPYTSASYQHNVDPSTTTANVGRVIPVLSMLLLSEDDKSTYTRISSGSQHTCVIGNDKTVKCWGLNNVGQLGNGTNVDPLVPVPVSNLSNVLNISAGWGHSCAVLADNTLKCWGWNQRGVLGNGTTVGSNVPISVLGISNAKSVSAGNFHTCVLLMDSRVKCWGYNDRGQLGNGLTLDSSVPVNVVGLNNVISISTGTFHSCALLKNKTVKCWGDNSDGQLGNGTNQNSMFPVTVTNITNAESISNSGSNQTCVVNTDKTINCWGGNNFGQLGNGSTASTSVPVLVNGINNAEFISTSRQHTCAALTDGTARCWGDGGSWRLGDGTLNSSSVPVQVSGISNALQISTGTQNSCVFVADNNVSCWGYNGRGELGNGSTRNSSVPTPVTFP